MATAATPCAYPPRAQPPAAPRATQRPLFDGGAAEPAQPLTREPPTAAARARSDRGADDLGPIGCPLLALSPSALQERLARLLPVMAGHWGYSAEESAYLKDQLVLDHSELALWVFYSLQTYVELARAKAFDQPVQDDLFAEGVCLLLGQPLPTPEPCTQRPRRRP